MRDCEVDLRHTLPSEASKDERVRVVSAMVIFDSLFFHIVRIQWNVSSSSFQAICEIKERMKRIHDGAVPVFLSLWFVLQDRLKPRPSISGVLLVWLSN